MDLITKPKRWHKKLAVAQRYGGVATRTIDRRVAAGALPKPKFPLGKHLPLWDGDELDAHDAQAGDEATAP